MPSLRGVEPGLAPDHLQRHVSSVIAGLRAGWARLPSYAWAVAVAATALALLAIGIPTDVVPNPWFTRMTPVRPADVVFLVLTALLTGALAATYLRRISDRTPGVAVGSGVLSVLAVGCPVCNKLVVGLLGFSGALTYFAPLQPILGALAVVLAATALGVRLRRLGQACSLTPGSRPADAPSST
jgi:hypothetical protein